MSARPPPRFLLLALAYLAFISLGLPDAVLGIVWPSLQKTFGVRQAALGWQLAIGALSYFFSGLFAGRLIQAWGVGSLLAASTALVVLGVAGYASAPSFAVVLLCASLVGFGSGAVDAGLNTYAAERFGTRHMAWLHAAYSVGAALGSAIITVVFARGSSFRTGYGVIACLLGALALAFVVTRRLWTRSIERSSASRPRARFVTAASAIRHAPVRLSSLVFFVYAGVEVGAGQWSYSILVQSRGLGTEAAGVCVTLYWMGLLAGRLLSGLIVERIGTVRLVRLGTFTATFGAALFAAGTLPVFVCVAGLSLVGLAIAPIYPGLMSETPRRVGEELAPHAVGFQVSAATAGVAILPSAAGLLGQRLGLEATAAFIGLCALALCVLHEVLVRGDSREGYPVT